MKFDTMLSGLTEAPAHARRLEQLGVDGAFTFEGPHDVFTPLVLAAGATQTLELATNVAIAFPRNPVQLAHQAYDLQLLAGGRFTLGLGSQIRAQVEKRYGASFDRPIARMREMVGALRAIFATWETGEPLDFQGVLVAHAHATPLQSWAQPVRSASPTSPLAGSVLKCSDWQPRWATASSSCHSTPRPISSSGAFPPLQKDSFEEAGIGRR